MKIRPYEYKCKECGTSCQSVGDAVQIISTDTGFTECSTVRQHETLPCGQPVTEFNRQLNDVKQYCKE